MDRKTQHSIFIRFDFEQSVCVNACHVFIHPVSRITHMDIVIQNLKTMLRKSQKEVMMLRTDSTVNTSTGTRTDTADDTTSNTPPDASAGGKDMAGKSNPDKATQEIKDTNDSTSGHTTTADVKRSEGADADTADTADTAELLQRMHAEESKFRALQRETETLKKAHEEVGTHRCMQYK